MPMILPRHRPLHELAEEILGDKSNFPVSTRTRLARLRSIDQVAGEEEYADLAQIRRLLGSWRSLLARRVKPEIDTILSLYRVTLWDEEPRAAEKSRAARSDERAAVR